MVAKIVSIVAFVAIFWILINPINSAMAQAERDTNWSLRVVHIDSYNDCQILTQGGRAIGISCYRKYQ